MPNDRLDGLLTVDISLSSESEAAMLAVAIVTVGEAGAGRPLCVNNGIEMRRESAPLNAMPADYASRLPSRLAYGRQRGGRY